MNALVELEQEVTDGFCTRISTMEGGVHSRPPGAKMEAVHLAVLGNKRRSWAAVVG